MRPGEIIFLTLMSRFGAIFFALALVLFKKVQIHQMAAEDSCPPQLAVEDSAV